MKRLFLFFSLLITLPFVSTAQCVKQNKAVPESGETLTYAAYFNWSAIWVKGGEAIFSAKKIGDYYNYKVSAHSMPKWRWVYDLNTNIEANMKSDMTPVSYSSSTYEEKKNHFEKITYAGDKLTYSYSTDQPGSDKTITVDRPDCSYDLLNEVYAARNLDLSSFEKGEQIPFDMFFTSELTRIYGEVLGEETIETRNGQKYDCIKCVANSIPGSIFDPKEPVYVWVTNDERHIPVCVQCKFKFGYIKVYLEDVK